MAKGKQALYVDIAAFQGPLDLLLHLIEQSKISIYDISIAVIADRFMESLQKMEALDMEVTTEFLVLASQLLYLKSRNLLPRPRKTEEECLEEELLKQDLVERLLTYRMYKQAAALLAARDKQEQVCYYREADISKVWEGFPPPNPLEGITLERLQLAFERVLAKAEEGTVEEVLTIEEVPVDLMIRNILRRLLLYPQGLMFHQLLRYHTKLEVVVAFLAVLELLRSGRLRAEQGYKSGEIFVVPTEKARYLADEEIADAFS